VAQQLGTVVAVDADYAYLATRGDKSTTNINRVTTRRPARTIRSRISIAVRIRIGARSECS
jgi:hypothetical protein